MKVLSVARRCVAPLLELGGAVALVAAGWDVARPLGLAVAGVAAIAASLALAPSRRTSSSS